MRDIVGAEKQRAALPCGCIVDGNGWKYTECADCARTRAAICIEEAVIILNRAELVAELRSLRRAAKRLRTER